LAAIDAADFGLEKFKLDHTNLSTAGRTKAMLQWASLFPRTFFVENDMFQTIRSFGSLATGTNFGRGGS
jgi:hypothetical protein